MISPADEFVLRLAHDHGLVTAAELEHARATATPGQHTVRNAPDILELLSKKLHLPLADLSARDLAIPATVLALVPSELAKREGLIPIAHEDGVLRVAVRDPFALDAIDRLAAATGLDVQPALASAEAIHSAIEKFYGNGTSEADPLSFALEATAVSESEGRGHSAHADESAAEEASDAPIIKLVYRIIHDAVRQRASDIHLEPLENRFRVRYRVDGVLCEAEGPPNVCNPPWCPASRLWPTSRLRRNGFRKMVACKCGSRASRSICASRPFPPPMAKAW